MGNNKMKKIVGIALLIVGIISTIVGAITLLNVKLNVPSNIAIIGGADGPTATFLAGKVGAPLYGAIIVGAVLVITGIIFLLKKKK